MAAVGKIIYKLLNDNGHMLYRIYPVEAVQNATLPYSVYNILSNYPANTKNGGSVIDVYRIQITTWGKRSDMENLYKESDIIRQILDQKRGSYFGITYDKIIYDGGQSEIYSIDGDLMGISVDYLVRIKN
jgi:hypothetical protein